MRNADPFCMSCTATPSSVIVVWSNFAPATSPVSVAPGCRVSNCEACRPRLGSRLMESSAITLPRLASTVCKGGSLAATSTEVAMVPISSLKSLVVAFATSSGTLLAMALLNPATSTDI